MGYGSDALSDVDRQIGVHSYEAVQELRVSDHRPVRAHFTVKLAHLRQRHERHRQAECAHLEREIKAKKLGQTTQSSLCTIL